MRTNKSRRVRQDRITSLPTKPFQAAMHLRGSRTSEEWRLLLTAAAPEFDGTPASPWLMQEILRRVTDGQSYTGIANDLGVTRWVVRKCAHAMIDAEIMPDSVLEKRRKTKIENNPKAVSFILLTWSALPAAEMARQLGQHPNAFRRAVQRMQAPGNGLTPILPKPRGFEKPWWVKGFAPTKAEAQWQEAVAEKAWKLLEFFKSPYPFPWTDLGRAVFETPRCEGADYPVITPEEVAELERRRHVQLQHDQEQNAKAHAEAIKSSPLAAWGIVNDK